MKHHVTTGNILLVNKASKDVLFIVCLLACQHIRMPEMNWKHEPLAESFNAFKVRMTLFLEDNEVTNVAKQATKIKIAVGDERMRRVLAFGLSDVQQNIPDDLWSLLESQVDATVKINF